MFQKWARRFFINLWRRISCSRILLPGCSSINLRSSESKPNLRTSIKGSICRLRPLFLKILGKLLKEYLIMSRESILSSCGGVDPNTNNKIRKCNILNYRYINRIRLLKSQKIIWRDQFRKRGFIKKR